MKQLKFVGSSQSDLREMPKAARQALGEALFEIQGGSMPSDFRYMPAVGSGVFEIRYRDADGAFRVMTVAKFAEAIYVLHAFQKKTQKTEKTDLELAKKRYSLIGG